MLKILFTTTAVAAVLAASPVAALTVGPPQPPGTPTTITLNAQAAAQARAAARATATSVGTGIGIGHGGNASATAPTTVSGGAQTTTVTTEDRRDWIAPSMPAPGSASPRACSHVVGFGVAGPFAGIGASWRSGGDDACEIEAFEPAVAEWDVLPAAVRALYCTASRIREAGLCGATAQAQARPAPAFPE
jgi:hypothetical protein